MDERFVNIISEKNSEVRIKILSGHFASRSAHINAYIDLSTVKTRHNNARETARILAEEYKTNTMIDTILSLKNTEVIASFLAEQLADTTNASLSAGNNISVVSPEYDSVGQIFLRDNSLRMIEGQQVLILTDSISTGQSLYQAIESVLYYGGTICGMSAVFSAISRVAGMDVKAVFTRSDLPDYHYYKPHECPMCQAGQRIEAMINSFGYSKLN